MNPSRSLRIAFLVGNFPSISETFILNQITGMLDAGHHVDIFAQRRPDETIVQPEVEAYRLLERTVYVNYPEGKLARALQGLGIVFNNLPRHPLRVPRALNVFRFGRAALSMRLLFTLQPFLNRPPYDIIHCHFGPLGVKGAQLKRLGLPGRLVVTFHGNDVSQVVASEGPGLYRDVFRQSDLLLPVSRYWRDCLERLGANPRRMRVHRMGIDPRALPYRPRTRGPDEETRLLTVGRLVEKKGIEFALRALAEVLRRRPGWNLRYDIIGEGPLCGGLQALVNDLGLQNVALLHGMQTLDEVKRLMLSAHLFLLPSVTAANGDQEGIPVSVMEAMASGMPVLSTRHTGIPELVQDGRTGFLVAERDVDGLSSRLEYLIERPHLWPLMGRAGRDFVLEHHNIHTLNRQLMETFLTLRSSDRPTLTISPRKSEA